MKGPHDEIISMMATLDIHDSDQDSISNCTAPTDTSALSSNSLSREYVQDTMESKPNAELIKIIQVITNNMESMKK